MDQKFEEAVNWASEQPHLQKDLYDSYLTPDVRADARRFYGSQEFQETLRILEEFGKGPWRDFALLDIGCGRGIGAYAFARCGYRVWAVDIGLGRLTGLEGARMLMGLDGAEFEVRQGNVLSLDFPHEFFDVIYARQFLHHMKGNLDETLYKLPPPRRHQLEDGLSYPLNIQQEINDSARDLGKPALDCISSTLKNIFHPLWIDIDY